MDHSSVDSLLRTSQAYCQQVCEKQTLDYGIAFYSEKFSGVAQANQFREVWIQEPGDVSKAYEQAESWFDEQGLRCRQWAPAGGDPSETLSDLLEERGFSRCDYAAMMLTRWPEIESDRGLRVLPARAMRAAFHAVIGKSISASDSTDRGQFIAVMDERLDDPPYDMFLAMRAGEPAGYGALYQVGDVARVVDLSVVEVDAHDAVTGVLLTHVLGLARRLALRNVVTQVPADDKERIALFERFGFVVNGGLTEFERST